MLLIASSLKAEVRPETYRTIKIEPIFSKLIIRNKDDRVYSGQIKSRTGVVEFGKIYGIEIDFSKIDFEEQMLIFGITDNISSRAFQFLQQEKHRFFTLDYADTGIEYKMRAPGKDKKYSFAQVFVLKKIKGISHIRIKNSVKNGLSRIYDK